MSGRRHLRVVASKAMEAGTATPPPLVTTRCTSCQAAIFFGVTAAGARSPYDTATRVQGAWHMTGEWVDTDHGPAPRMVFAPRRGEGYVTHWKTCPYAADHRAPKVNPAQISLVPEDNDAT